MTNTAKCYFCERSIEDVPYQHLKRTAPKGGRQLNGAASISNET